MPRLKLILPSWVAMVEIVRQLEEQLYHWPVTHSMFNTIAYVATRQGLPTGFVLMFAADALKMEKRDVPTEVEVFEAVLKWKQKRRPPLNETTVASTIRNLGMLRWLDIRPDAALRVPEEESISA